MTSTSLSPATYPPQSYRAHEVSPQETAIEHLSESPSQLVTEATNIIRNHDPSLPVRA